MKNKLKKISTLAFISLISGCNDFPNQNKVEEIGNISLNVNLDTSKINLLNKEKVGKFNTKALDPSDVFYGQIEVIGSGISSPITNAVSNPVRLPNGKLNNPENLNLQQIPSGNNRVIKVKPLDSSQTSMGDNLIIMGVVNVPPNVSVNANVSWQTTPTAKVIEDLLNNSSPYADSVSNLSLQSLVDKIINNNTIGNTTDDIHPSLVDFSSISTFIQNNSGVMPNPTTTVEISNYRVTPLTISGKINGITYQVPGVNQVNVKYIPPTKVVVNDASSKIETVTDLDGNYTVSGVSPGSNYKVTVIPDFYDNQSVSNISAGSTNINFNPIRQHYLQHSITQYGTYRFPHKNTRSINVLIIKPTPSRATSIGWVESLNKQGVINAINDWNNIANDVISFNIMPEIVENDPNKIALKNSSDIYIEWVSNLSGNLLGHSLTCPNTNSGPPASSSGCSLQTSSMPYNNTYKNAITLATKAGANLLTEPSISQVPLHEIGHALGLAFELAGTANQHPTDNIEDLMYPNVNFSTPTNVNVNIRDLNTVRFLYSIPGNITKP